MTTLVLIAGLVAIFGGIALVVMSVGVLTTERSGVTRSLAAVEALGAIPGSTREQLDPPFSQRVLLPAFHRLTALARRFTPQERIERLSRRMEFAGMPREWTVDRILAAKALGVFALGGFLALFLLMQGRPAQALILGAGGALLGWYLPEILLKNKAQKRSQQIQRSLPDVLDLLTISVEAGMGFDAALGNVARNSDGPLAEEFFRVLHEMQLGTGRMDTLRALADRTDVEDLRLFVSAMVQADAFGIPIANVLRTQAREMRIKRGQRAEEKAMKVPVKMMIPLILCIMPTLLVVIIGPGVVSIYENFVNR